MIFIFTLRFGSVDLMFEVPLRLSAFHFVSGYGCLLFFVRNLILPSIKKYETYNQDSRRY